MEQQAQPSPAGARPQVPDQILYEGPARHSVRLGAYFKWIAVCIVGGGAAWGLGQVQALEAYPRWVLVFVGFPGLAWTYLVHVTTRFKITNRRVEMESGVLAKELKSLELWRVLDVGFRQSLVDRFFGNARITLVGTDQSDPELMLHGMPDPRKLFESLRDAVQEARRAGRPMEMVAGEGFTEMV
jgi:hypothetical protein